ncbi:MAG: hypothetical protein Q9M22_02095, partial [Mariprofundaceae bacterium]|nr:hypothetical protein [Mariprofundaceae bacterium]
KSSIFDAFGFLADCMETYEEEQADLSLGMMEEIDKHAQWIMRNPTVPRMCKGRYRRVNLKTFPYYIAYMVHVGTLWILAIAHNHRKSEYWITRKNKIS